MHRYTPAMEITRRTFASTLAAAAFVRGGLNAQRAALAGAGSLTDVPGLRVGHWTDTRRPTGCTAILFDPDASAGVDYNGSAPGETGVVLLQPVSPIESVHGLFLSGGGQFGLGAHAGMIRYLEDQKRGFDWGGSIRVPIAPGAVIDDLALGDPTIRPDPQSAYKACEAASSQPVAEGNVGAGAGATVGKWGVFAEPPGYAGRHRSPMKGGIGSAAIQLPNGLAVGALVAVNAVGDIIDPRSGQVVAGARNPDGTIADVRKLLATGAFAPPARPGENTTIGVVATNARLSKEQASRVALMADDGLARAINPSHTVGDGDTVFALATGTWTGEVNVSLVGALAAEAMSEAIVRAVARAESLAGVPSARELGTVPARLR